MAKLLIFLMLPFSFCCIAQEGKKGTIKVEKTEAAKPGVISMIREDTSSIDIPRAVVGQMPNFPGGDLGLTEFIRTTMRYPEPERQGKVEGTVYVSFMVQANGTLTDIKLWNGVTVRLDNEALRIVSLMPKWTPGKQGEVPVPMQVTVPIKFQL